MRRALIAIWLAYVPTAFAATAGHWVPEVKFKLENADYLATLLWVSGFWYAVTEIAKESKKLGLSGPYCLPKDGVIGSKIILDSLNEKFPGKTITSEGAAATAMQKIKAQYPCAIRRSTGKAIN